MRVSEREQSAIDLFFVATKMPLDLDEKTIVEDCPEAVNGADVASRPHTSRHQPVLMST
jgi:hypothetical protein